MAIFLLSEFFGNSFLALAISTFPVIAIWLYFKYSYTYWKRKGVPYLQPKFPLGNNDCLGPEAISYGIESKNWHDGFRKMGVKFGGVWSFSKPLLVLVDPDYIKDVLVKDFSYFVDRDFFHNPQKNPKNENLFVVEKDVWKNQRQKLTPTFTSAKMKTMFHSVVNCSKPMIDFIGEAAKMGHDVDLKEILASFTTDAIGCVAFGLEFNCLTEKDSQFRAIGKKGFEADWYKKIQILFVRLAEKTAKLLGVCLDKEASDFFTEIVKNNVEYRRKNNVHRPDFTQLLMELQESTKDQEKPFTFDDFVANIMVFFFAGFETSSTTMCFALYELVRNPELQEKTRREIQTVLKKYNGELTYESFQEMTYVRQVIDETLRLYPPVMTLARVCVKDYTLRGTNVTIEKGTTVAISTIGLGRDPEYFPDPDKFDPERFSSEMKSTMNPYVYLPFGEGPRNCIGRRFGIMQSTIGLIRILSNFKIETSPSSKMPLTLAHGQFLLKSNETLFIKAKNIDSLK